MHRALVLALALSTSALGSPALAKPACDELAGHVLFVDTLYGVGTGAVLSGLVLAAAEDDEDTGPKMAGGTLIGATVGLVAGGIELGMRDCNDKAAAAGKVQAGLAVTASGPALAMGFSW